VSNLNSGGELLEAGRLASGSDVPGRRVLGADDPRQITFDEWDSRYRQLKAEGLCEEAYGGPLRRHFSCGSDLRLRSLRFDDSPAALRLWNFLLTENDRLKAARAQGKKIVGTMKDLGTVPVMAFSASRLTAFYPDGAWWIPCVMEFSDGLLRIADSLGIDESFCPVRAVLGAFQTEAHFPKPDLLICSVGATCDDFSVIAQRLNGLGHPILWWEIPSRRAPELDEVSVPLPGGGAAPEAQVTAVKTELGRVRCALEELAGEPLDEMGLAAGIRAANRVRHQLAALRHLVFTAEACPLPALELLIAEMLAIHFCSDRGECTNVLQQLLDEVQRRAHARQGLLPREAVRIFWVNPVADLRVMNLLEECGGRLCGTDFMFCHALDEIPEDLPALEALARAALADPMVGTSIDRSERICNDIRRFGAEGLVISRIPGASHCAWEGRVIGERVSARLGLPVLEIEVPPVCDSVMPSLRSRLEALVETVQGRRAA
jgi:benzoyl-CoA reductase/2-hydroxyglutaryl-CoA dehydratase subunit BcrC/BadD/HgdB